MSQSRCMNDKTKPKTISKIPKTKYKNMIWYHILNCLIRSAIRFRFKWCCSGLFHIQQFENVRKQSRFEICSLIRMSFFRERNTLMSRTKTLWCPLSRCWVILAIYCSKYPWEKNNSFSTERNWLTQRLCSTLAIT